MQTCLWCRHRTGIAFMTYYRIASEMKHRAAFDKNCSIKNMLCIPQKYWKYQHCFEPTVNLLIGISCLKPWTVSWHLKAKVCVHAWLHLLLHRECLLLGHRVSRNTRETRCCTHAWRLRIYNLPVGPVTSTCVSQCRTIMCQIITFSLMKVSSYPMLSCIYNGCH